MGETRGERIFYIFLIICFFMFLVGLYDSWKREQPDKYEVVIDKSPSMPFDPVYDSSQISFERGFVSGYNQRNEIKDEKDAWILGKKYSKMYIDYYKNLKKN
jgi:hypothetical protein